MNTPLYIVLFCLMCFCFHSLIKIAECFIRLHRNEEVYKYRRAILHKIAESGGKKEDYAVYDSANYDEMVEDYERSLRSFFKGKFSWEGKK